MTTYIFPFSETSASLDSVGGKGLSLARMWQAGFPVPPGFLLTTEAYRSFVIVNGLQSRILKAVEKADPADTVSLDAASQVIGEMFKQGSIPPEVTDEIFKAYGPFRDSPVAVRSSATAEDLPGASFAGQQETFLNILGREHLLEAVRKCWASLWTARAISYRIKNEIDQTTVALAVVVQELIFAEAAGILFTANPVNGRRNEILINAAWGLGEAIVSGAVTPDTLTVDKATGKVKNRLTAEKEIMTLRTATGTEEKPVPPSERKQPVLSNRQAAELADLGKKIEAFYGMPMDIEWAFADGKFFIVQARPITALPPDWIVPDAKAVYARGSLAEHIPGPVTPLFATLGIDLANQATAQLWDRTIGKNAASLIAGRGAYTTINGFVYGGFRLDFKGTWAATKVSISQIGPMFRGSVARWQAARDELAVIVKTWEEKPIETLSPSELLQGVRTVFGAACHYFTVIQTTLPAASSSETMFVKFYNGFIKRKLDPEASAFLLGYETSSLRAEKSLFDLAMWLKSNSTLMDYVLHSPTDILLVDFKHETRPGSVSEELWSGWQSRFQNHLNEFGRTTYDFDFSNPTPAETPGPLLEAVKAFLSEQANNPYERQQSAVTRRELATQTVLDRIGWPLKGWFKKLLRWAQETGPMREDSITDLGMGHPVVRRMLGELGRRFAAAEAIKTTDDIYWLEEQEVETLISLLELGVSLPDFNDRIPARKADWQASFKLSPPIMLPEKSGWSKFIHGEEAVKKDGKLVLKGVGTSSGIVTAPACVLFGPEDFNQMKPGDVLVAVTTNPAWTPLFTLASAVVTDIGGPLSHSSIVAREYGIPAVMAARSATRLIQNGQMITVDGGTGTVMFDSPTLPLV